MTISIIVIRPALTAFQHTAWLLLEKGPKHKNDTRKNRNVKYYPQLKWFGSTSMASSLWAKPEASWYLFLTLRTPPYYQKTQKGTSLFTRQKAGERYCSMLLLQLHYAWKTGFIALVPVSLPACWAPTRSGRTPELRGCGWRHGARCSPVHLGTASLTSIATR